MALDLGKLSLFGGGTRFVLSIGDEAAVLTLIKGKGVAGAWVADPDPADGAAEVLEALRRHRTAPVYVLMDAFEQMFREEKVPRVNLFDQGKVVRRYLSMTFPGNNLQGAVPHGRDPQGNQYYLFASVPPTEQVSGWLTVLEEAGRPPRSIHMLPLESLSMLRALTPRTEIQGVRWRMLFSFNMAGGLRQIVSKQKRIMLARLTPPPRAGGAVDVAAIIERDFQQTLAYVKRMGYQQGDHLDVVVIAEDPLASQIKARPWEVHSLTVLSPGDAGAALGLGTVGQPGQPYADVLHALWFATRPKGAMTLDWAQKPRADLQRLVARAAPAAAVAVSLGLTGYTGSLALDLMDYDQRIAAQKADLDLAQRQRDAAAAKLADLPYPPEAVRAGVSVAAAATADAVPAVDILNRLAAGIAGDGTVTALEISTPEADPDNRRQQEAEAPWTVGVTLRLPAGIAEDDAAVRRAEAVHARLMDAFDGHEVRLERPPVEINPDQTLRGGAAPPGTPETRDYTVDFRIIAPEADS